MDPGSRGVHPALFARAARCHAAAVHANLPANRKNRRGLVQTSSSRRRGLRLQRHLQLDPRHIPQRLDEQHIAHLRTLMGARVTERVLHRFTAMRSATRQSMDACAVALDFPRPWGKAPSIPFKSGLSKTESPQGLSTTRCKLSSTASATIRRTSTTNIAEMPSESFAQGEVESDQTAVHLRTALGENHSRGLPCFPCLSRAQERSAGGGHPRDEHGEMSHVRPQEGARAAEPWCARRGPHAGIRPLSGPSGTRHRQRRSDGW
jgi:hypothetical protein